MLLNDPVRGFLITSNEKVSLSIDWKFDTRLMRSKIGTHVAIAYGLLATALVDEAALGPFC